MQERREQYRPHDDETLGQYLRRLRELAGAVQGRPIKLDDLVQLSADWPQPQRFTAAWLSKAESDGFQYAGGDRLRTLAAIYSGLLKVPVPEAWLLVKAGYKILETETATIERLMQYREMLALVALAGQLIEQGYLEDVQLLIASARRYFAFRNPDLDPGDIFQDPALAEHVRSYLDKLGL